MAHKALEELERRNKHLEEELQTLRDLFQNLHEEKDLESPDQRRSFMLKAQNYQLERQCMLLSQAQANRASVLTEIECQLQKISENFQDVIAGEKSGPNVVVKRSQIMEFIGAVKKLKNSLYKQSQLESSDSLRIPSLMSGSKYASTRKPLNCIDVCQTRGDDLNLKYIANLEQQLSFLYKRLTSFKSSLDASILGNAASVSCENMSSVQGYFVNPAFSRLRDESKHCISELKLCCDQLLALSLLHPSAPWSAVRKSDDFDNISFEKVMQSLPANAQRNAQIRSTVQEVCKAHNYSTHMQKLKIDAMQAKLEYHQATAKLHHQYLTDLSTAMLVNYNKWKEETINTICAPIAGVLQLWSLLKGNQSGENLKNFLAEFKKCEMELEKVSALGTSATSPFTDDLLSSLMKRLDTDLQGVAIDCSAKIAEAEKVLSQ